MTFRVSLADRKNAILQRWFDTILDTYPADTARFLKNKKDRFANPVGATFLEGMDHVLEELFQETVDRDRVIPHLDSIVRIRAVQQFTPSQALGFIFLLKKIIREILDEEGKQQAPVEPLTDLDSDIDSLAMLAFNIYMECREKIYEIRANEVKRSTYKLLKMANLVTEDQEPVADIQETEFIKIKGKEAAQ